MMKFFKKKPQPKRKKIVEKPGAGLPMVTTFLPLNDGPVAVIDAEGALWEVNRSENLVYLSGDDGEVQAQFNLSDFKQWLETANQLAR